MSGHDFAKCKTRAILSDWMTKTDLPWSQGASLTHAKNQPYKLVLF